MVQETQARAGDAYKVSFTYTGDCTNILADRQLLHKIVGNLLSNAVKFSPAGGPVQLDLTCQAGRVTIRIQDRGTGIPPEDQKHLFEPFHRAGNVGTLPGVGLGLAIARKAVVLHGGTIGFESQTHDSQTRGGTTFVVTLPHGDARTN